MQNGHVEELEADEIDDRKISREEDDIHQKRRQTTFERQNSHSAANPSPSAGYVAQSHVAVRSNLGIPTPDTLRPTPDTLRPTPDTLQPASIKCVPGSVIFPVQTPSVQ